MTLELELANLEFSIRRSIRYHMRRRAYFETCHALTMFFIIVLSSGSFIGNLAKIGGSGIDIYVGILVTILATLDLVIGFSIKAKNHEILSKNFSHLLIEMQMNAKVTKAKMAEWTKTRLNIEADEPPIYRALDVSCHNEESRAQGFKTREMCELPFWLSVTMHFFRWSDINWDKIRTKKKKSNSR